MEREWIEREPGRWSKQIVAGADRAGYYLRCGAELSKFGWIPGCEAGMLACGANIIITAGGKSCSELADAQAVAEGFVDAVRRAVEALQAEVEVV